MSSIARAFQADVPIPAHKLVLLAMVALSRREGSQLYFSLPTSHLAGLAQIDINTLMGALAALTRQGLIADTGDRVGRQSTKVFELNLPEAER